VSQHICVRKRDSHLRSSNVATAPNGTTSSLHFSKHLENSSPAQVETTEMYTSKVRKYYTCEERKKSIRRVVPAKNTQEAALRLAPRKRGIANAIQVLCSMYAFSLIFWTFVTPLAREDCVKGPNNLLEQQFLALCRAL
jgi:hypothetical protein